LKKACDLLYERTKAFRRLFEIRKVKPSVISGRDFFLIVHTSFYTDPKEWTRKTNELCQELEANINKKTRKPKPRILLTGAPTIWPNFKVLHLIENEMEIVADDICSGTQHLYEPVEIDENTMDGIIKAISDKYLLPNVCPCFVNNDDRIDKILTLVEDFKVDGVVYHVLRLCQIFDIESEVIKEVLEKKNIPMLKITTEYSEEDKEQIRTRVEAFQEMLITKKNF
jgi:benzoyl-CoA reductase/2-hydroxyglutaryl-CoA dehydratase subunit BcrC/BadD/HgdB